MEIETTNMIEGYNLERDNMASMAEVSMEGTNLIEGNRLERDNMTNLAGVSIEGINMIERNSLERDNMERTIGLGGTNTNEEGASLEALDEVSDQRVVAGREEEEANLGMEEVNATVEATATVEAGACLRVSGMPRSIRVLRGQVR